MEAEATAISAAQCSKWPRVLFQMQRYCRSFRGRYRPINNWRQWRNNVLTRTFRGFGKMQSKFAKTRKTSISGRQLCGANTNFISACLFWFAECQNLRRVLNFKIMQTNYINKRENVNVNQLSTDCSTGWTIGWKLVYTMQQVVQPVWQSVVSCKRGLTWHSIDIHAAGATCTFALKRAILLSYDNAQCAKASGHKTC